MPVVDIVRVIREAMGTAFEVALVGDDPDELTRAAEAALDEVDALDEQLSVYIEASDVSAINAEAAAKPVRVEPELFDLLMLCQRLHRETAGAFDITVGPLLRCWGFYRRKGRVPPAGELAKARRLVGMDHVTLDPKARTIAFDRRGVAIDLGGIGKGVAVDRVADELRRLGHESFRVHGGTSSVYARGAPPGRKAWQVSIRHPLVAKKRLATLELSGRALSTSGGYERFFDVGGKRYCHIIEPRTGRPVQGMLSCSVLTPNATEGDALSTALFVLGVEGARRYCRKHKDVEAILVPVPPRGQPPRLVRIGGTTKLETK